MQTYIVVKGDSLWLIAKKFGVTLEELVKANPQIKDPNRIYPGNKINIPLPTQGGSRYYTVQPGDTMWLIAKKFGISLDALLKANPQIVDADRIDIGQKIVIPGKGVSPQPPAPPCPPAHPCPPTPPMPPMPPQTPGGGENNGKLYFVRKGDTFFNIAQRYAINLETLILANPQIADADAIVEGMQLYIPGFHYVKAGETLFSIAKRYGVELKTLIRINPQIKNPDRIEVGQKIAIPRRANGDMAVYTVKQGDTLFKIAQKYNLTVESILNANPSIEDPNRIFPGQKLAIPGPHQVQKGQSLWEIANIYDISLEELIRANPQIENENLIYPQTMVIIPPQRRMAPPARECAGISYIVQPGDTLYHIGGMYHVSVECLIKANPQIQNADLIYPGQKINIPVGCSDCVCYMVKEGDTLTKIARMYGLSVRAIMASNPMISNADYIEVGWNLMIPIKGHPCTRQEEEDFEERAAVKRPTLYTVEKGESLYSIAAKFKVTVKQLLMANPQIEDENRIYPDEVLLILPMNYKLFIEN